MKKIEKYHSQSRHEILQHIPGKVERILDVGCGEGWFLRLVKERDHAETWGIEVDEGASEIALKNCDQLIVGKIEDVIERMPNNYFDCISFNDVLEHLVNPEYVLKLITKKLNSNGIIVASLPNVRYIFNLYDLIIKKDWEYKDYGILDRTHLRFFTQKSATRFFENSGFNLIKCDGINEYKALKFKICLKLTFGLFSDSKYQQFLFILKKNNV